MKKLVIHTPKLSAIKFVGNFDKKLFEVGARKTPILKHEDENIIIVTEMEASLLTRTPHFEKANIEDLFVNENKPFNIDDLSESDIEEIKRLFVPAPATNILVENELEVKEIIVDENQDTYTLPFLEDLEALELDEVKLACDFVDIQKGNLGIVKLKALLQPHLKSKDS